MRESAIEAFFSPALFRSVRTSRTATLNGEMFKAVPHAFLYTEQGPVRWVR
jgi:hypothetical protein